jgi:hypothetical protein
MDAEIAVGKEFRGLKKNVNLRNEVFGIRFWIMK